MREFAILILMRIVVLVGLPGSGKSTWLERIGAVGLSSDAVRKLLADDESDQTIHARVFQTIRFLLEQRLAIGRPVTYIDATSLTRKERAPYLEIGRTHGVEVEAIFFDVPLEVCLRSQARRQRVVLSRTRWRRWRRSWRRPRWRKGFTRVVVRSRNR